MPTYREVHPDKMFMGKLPHNSDLLTEITRLCAEQNIHIGRVEAIGAVQKARVGYYHQQTKKYEFIELNEHLEITALIGNVSIKDNKPIIHAHITLSDNKGNTYGGHLAPGTIVFVCEFILETFVGPVYTRGLDEVTGLPLWTIK
jgi:uncharacterized protein